MKIITPVTNNPEFIRLQFHTLKKYINVPFEFIVFNDAKQFPDFSNFDDPTIWGKIVTMCESLGIQCINIPNDHHRHVTNPGQRHIDAMKYITEFMFTNPDKYLQLDSDMFLLDELSISTLEQYHCAIIKQDRPGITYVWPNLFYFDIPKLLYKDLIKWDYAPGTDTGGQMSTWLAKYVQNHPESIYYIDSLSSCQWNEKQLPHPLQTTAILNFLKNDIRNTNDGQFWCELYHNCILHYRAGSNWNREGSSIHSYMTEQLIKCIGV